MEDTPIFNRLISFVFPVCLALFNVSTFAEQIPAKVDRPEAAQSVDITKSVEEMNSEKFAAPPTDFRAGHVTVRELGKDYLKVEAAGGFSIQLPSRAPVPTPVVVKDKLFTSGGFHSKEFYCFNAQSGKLIWGVNLDDDGPSTAAYSDGVIVFNTESCTVFALDADTGKMLWSLYLGDPLTSSPTIDKGIVFTSYPAGTHAAVQAANNAPNGVNPPPNASHVLAALELKTGRIVWQRWLDSDVMSAPIAVDGELYVTSFAGVIYRFKQKDGKIISATRSRATSAPVVVGNKVFVTKRDDAADSNKSAEHFETNSSFVRDTNKEVFASEKKKADYLDANVQAGTAMKVAGGVLDAGNGFAAGAPKPANPTASLDNVGQDNVSTMQSFQGSRMAYLGGSTFNCMGDECICMEAGAGAVRWRFKLEGDLKKEGGFLGSPPATAGGRIFLATLRGEVLQADPVKGTIEKKFTVGSPVRSQPIIEGGRIYVGTQDGRIVCFDTGIASFTGWNHWGCNAARTGTSEEK